MSSAPWTSGGSAYSLFQTAIMLEGRVRTRTEELTGLMHRLERSNEALAAAKEEAETANRSKTRFLAAASHDLLQPVNAARLSISAMADLDVPPEARTIASQVERGLADHRRPDQDALGHLQARCRHRPAAAAAGLPARSAGRTRRELQAVCRAQGPPARNALPGPDRHHRRECCSSASCRTSSRTPSATLDVGRHRAGRPAACRHASGSRSPIPAAASAAEECGISCSTSSSVVRGPVERYRRGAGAWASACRSSAAWPRRWIIP